MIKTPPIACDVKNKKLSDIIYSYDSVTDPFLELHHTGPQVMQKKNGCHIWPNYDIKNFFQKKLNVPHAPNIEPLLLHSWPLNTPVSSKMWVTRTLR